MPRSLTALAFVAVFAALVVTTIAGVAANWPRHRSIPGSAQFRPAKTYGADVVAMRAAPCRAPLARHCSVVTVRLADGPDKGRRASLRFGDGAGDPRVGLGD